MSLIYVLVCDMLPEVEATHLIPFTGMQMFYGIPEPRLISFMQVQGIEKCMNILSRMVGTKSRR